MKMSAFNKTFDSILKLNAKYGLLISSLIIAFLFFISHYWFFRYLPLTYSNIDSFQYFSLQKLWDMGHPVNVGYPSYGYILFLHIISLFHDSLYAVSLVTSLISLSAVLFLNYAIHKYIDKKFIIWTGLVLGSFLAASSTVFFNTTVFPDALLSSLYIFFIGSLIFMLKAKKQMFWIIFASFIIVFSIFVRPSSLLLLPISAGIIIFMILLRMRKQAFYFLGFIALFALIVSIHNYYNPLYRSFKLYESSSSTLRIYIHEEYYALNIINDSIYFENRANINTKINEIIDLLPQENILHKAKHPQSWRSFYDARDKTLRGVVFSFDSTSNYLLASNHARQYLFTVDSVIETANLNEYKSIKSELYNYLNYSEHLFRTISVNNYWRLVLFRKFFSFFYDKTATELSPLQYGNIEWRYNLYSTEERINRTGFYTDVYANYLKKPEIREILFEHSTKEFYKMYEDKNFNYNERYANMQNNLFFKIYDIYKLKIHYNLFQNFFAVLIFAAVFLSSIFYLLIYNIRNITAYIVMIICLILIGLALIHSLHYVYYRYTYSSSFVYFVILSISPALLKMFLTKHWKKIKL